MKNIHDKLSESLKKLSEIDKFLDTLAYLSKDNIVANTILPEITKRTLEMRNIGMDAIVNCNKLISKSKGTNRFDIMKSDGSIEIGLVSKDANTLIKMYEMSGEKIQILREINEFGFIVNEKEPNHNDSVTDFYWGEPITGKELYNVLHPSKKEKTTEEFDLDKIDDFDYPVPDTDIPPTLDREYKKFIENPVTYEDSTKRIIEDYSNDEDNKLDNLLTKWKNTLKCDKKVTKKTSKKSQKKTTKKSKK